jgi:hypothetical protein
MGPEPTTARTTTGGLSVVGAACQAAESLAGAGVCQCYLGGVSDAQRRREPSIDDVRCPSSLRQATHLQTHGEPFAFRPWLLGADQRVPTASSLSFLLFLPSQSIRLLPSPAAPLL